MTLSDLICVMRDGKIVQTGSPSEIYTKPRDRYVAEFVGKPKMSVLEGALTQGADGVTFTNADTTIHLGTAAELGLKDGAWPAVAFGVRAEDVIVEAEGAAADPSTFSATVGLMEPIGSDTFVELSLGASTIVARVSPDLPISLGQPVTASLRPSGIHLFDRETGERIIA